MGVGLAEGVPGAQVEQGFFKEGIGCEVDAPAPSYAAHADGAAGVGLHAGRVALLVGSSFLSGFNGMQQRAALVAAAVGKLGFAVLGGRLGYWMRDCGRGSERLYCNLPGTRRARVR